MAEPMLKIDDINVYYGAIHAIKGISLTVNQGEIVTLIGANGAGKSTTLRTISGLLKPKTGSITFQGQDIAGTPAHKIVGLGGSQVPGGRRGGRRPRRSRQMHRPRKEISRGNLLCAESGLTNLSYPRPATAQKYETTPGW